MAIVSGPDCCIPAGVFGEKRNEDIKSEDTPLVQPFLAFLSYHGSDEREETKSNVLEWIFTKRKTWGNLDGKTLLLFPKSVLKFGRIQY